MKRREALQAMASAASLALMPNVAASRGGRSMRPSRLGLVIYCCRLRRDFLKRTDADFDLFEPTNFLAHCRSVGAGGMQISLGVLDSQTASKLRRQAEQDDLHIEAIIPVPKQKKDVERFEAQIKTAAAVGVIAVRTTIIPGRRYEFFDSLEKFRDFDQRGRRALEWAAPIVEKHRVPLAVENHKDHRNQQRVEMLKHISSEFVGACVDTGNSFALLEDPIETIRALAPWAFSVHLKDQAVQLYDDGFLLADIPLGQGFLDLKTMVAILREAKPNIRFNLELITRDPLKVPCLQENYWPTFPEVPGRDLARTLRLVRNGASDNLQYPSKMSPDQQLAREDANVRDSLDYARDKLGI